MVLNEISICIGMLWEIKRAPQSVFPKERK